MSTEARGKVSLRHNPSPRSRGPRDSRLLLLLLLLLLLCCCYLLKLLLPH
jgi:hypothetical protein